VKARAIGGSLSAIMHPSRSRCVDIAWTFRPLPIWDVSNLGRVQFRTRPTWDPSISRRQAVNNSPTVCAWT
jgi:hypothetical protein